MDEAQGGQEEREFADALTEVDELIEQGQYTPAQALCRELLGRHPTSAAVHEKMGDVLYHRELWQDAAEWYELAAQLSDTPEIRAKIPDAKRRAKEARLGGPEPEEIAARAYARQRMLLLLLGLAAVVTMIVAAVVVAQLLGARQPAAPPVLAEQRGAPAAPRSLGLTGPRAARSIRPSPRAPGSVTRAQENPAEHWAASEASPRPPPRRRTGGTVIEVIADPVTEADRAVILAVSSLTWGDTDLKGRVAAQVDPYSGFAMISVTIPIGVPEGNLLERVVRQAHHVCLTAIRTEESIRYITIRMLKRVGRSKAPVTAFRGNTSRAVLEEYPDSNVNFDILWGKVFRTTWWNPQVGGRSPAENEETSVTGLP